MNGVLKLFLLLSISGSIIGLILLLLTPLLKDRFSKTWNYYIWIIVIARLLLPFTVQIEFAENLFAQVKGYLSVPGEKIAQQLNISSFVADDSTPEALDMQNIELDYEPTQNQLIPALNEGETNKMQFLDYWNEFKNYIWLLWLGVAVLLFVRKATGYYDFTQFIKAGRNDIQDTTILDSYDRACNALNINKPPTLYVNKMATAPMLVGIIRQFIILPCLELSDEDAYNIFIHELTHYKRKDIFYKWLVQLAVCVHWYNPLVYVISREINKNCELSCDEAIIKNLNAEGKKQYGNTLITALKLNGNYGNATVSITLNEDGKLLKERLGAIMKFKKKSKLTVIFSMIWTMAIFCGTLTTGAYAATDKQNNVTVARNIELVKSEFVKENGVLKCRLDFQNKTGIDISLFYFNFEGYNASGEIVANSINNTNSLGKIIAPNQIESVYLGLPQDLQKLKLGIIKYDTTQGYSVSIHDNQIAWKWIDVSHLVLPPKATDSNVIVSDPSDIALVEYEFYFINGITPAITPTFRNNTSSEIKKIGVEVKFIEFGENSYTYNTEVSAKPGEIFIPSSWGLATNVNQIKLGVTSYTVANGTNYQIAEDKIEWHNISINNKLTHDVRTNPSTSLQQIDLRGLSEVDKAAIELMQYSGSWDIVELLIPNMSQIGIEGLVEAYNQKNMESNHKKAADYYHFKGSSADVRALTMMQRNGMWKYTAPLFPYMSNEGIEKVVALYNQKHSDKKIAVDFYNTTLNSNGNIAINLINKNTFNIAESGTFQAEDNQILALDIISSIKGGAVDLFLFAPDGEEHRISIGSSNLTKEIKLSKGLWQYNCSGIFQDGGNIKVSGILK